MAKVRLYGETSGFVDLKAPDVANDVTITLPNATGAFATEPYVNAAVAAIPEIAGIGSNVVQAVKTDVFTTSSSTYANIGLSATITPSSNTAKVLAITSVQATGSNSTNNGGLGVRLFDGTNASAVGDAAGARRRLSAVGNRALDTWFIDSVVVMAVFEPATTSPYTINVQGNRDGTSGVAYVNRSSGDIDSASHSSGRRAASYLLIVEVAP